MKSVRLGDHEYDVTQQKSKSSRPKLAQLVPTITSSGGGVAEAVRLLHDAIVADGGWQVELHTIESPGFQEARADYGDTPVFGARRRDFTRFGFSPELFRQLLRSDADVLHVHGLWGFHCLVAHFWHLKTGRPYIITPHGMLGSWILKRSRLFKALLMMIFQERLLRGAAAVHALTENERLDVEEVMPGLPTVVVPNFVAAPCNDQDPVTPSWWRPELKGRTIFLFFGRIHEKKGCMELCEAWERRCCADPEFSIRNALVFCGWIDGLTALPERVAQLDQLFGNVVFGGPQFGTDKWSTLSAGTYMVLPSKSEGLPLSILEAWAKGLPVLITPECNLPEGFSAGAAIRISQEVIDIEAGLAHAAALSGAEYASMVSAAHHLARSTFSQRAAGQRMIALYNSARQSIYGKKVIKKKRGT